MTEPMVRKQIYIPQAQNQKLKRIAAERHCTEAEVVRTALDRLPDPDGDDIEKLRAAGMLLEVEGIEPMDPAVLQELERQIAAWHRARGKPVGLSQAVLDEREESPW
jgi:hypothetical protein